MHRPWKQLPLPVAAGRPLQWGQLHGCAPALAIAEAAARHDGPVLVLAGSPRQADQLAAELAFFGGPGLEVLPLPDAETLPWDAFSPHPDITSRRLATLARLPALARGVVVAATQTLLQRLPPPAWTATQGLDISTGDRLDTAVLRRQLQDAGYLAVGQVTEHGEFALRGSLLDLYPMGSDLPYRIDLFDDLVDSIRRFDPGTQRSLERLDRIRLLPGREYPFSEDAIRGFRARFRERFPGDPSRVGVYRDVGDGIASGGLEYYLPLFFETLGDLADYLPEGTLVVEAEPAGGTLEQAWAGVLERHDQLAHDIERPILGPEEVFSPPATLAERLAQFPTIRLTPFKQLGEGADLGAAVPPAMRLDPRAPEPAAALLEFLLEFEGRVLFTAESPGRRELLRSLLAGHGIAVRSVDDWPAFLAADEPRGLAVAPLEEGLLLPEAKLAVIAEPSCSASACASARGAGAARAIRRRSSVSCPTCAIGAPVVHVDLWRGPLSRAGDARGTGSQQRVPRTRVCRRRQALRARAVARPDQPLHRGGAGIRAAAPARRRAMAESPATRRRESARRGSRVARPARPQRGARGAWLRAAGAGLCGLPGGLPVRRNARPARGDRARDHAT
jgi:transcription-repair coupling factor (superfamily II helicase)